LNEIRKTVQSERANRVNQEIANRLSELIGDLAEKLTKSFCKFNGIQNETEIAKINQCLHKNLNCIWILLSRTKMKSRFLDYQQNKKLV